jgi:prefoldin subunit 5
MADLDTLKARIEMFRSEIKTVERHARMVKQLGAQIAEEIETLQPTEAQGNGSNRE